MIAKDICRKYNESADKAEMIQVLADLEGCTKRDIIELLKANGCDIPPKFLRGKKKSIMPDVVKEALCEKMEKIDCRIKELEPYRQELESLERQYQEIATYLCG